MLRRTLSPLLLICASALTPASASAAACPVADIYYINGVKNTDGQALISRDALQEVVKEATSAGCNAPQTTLNWNRSDGWLTDLAQASVQVRDGVALDDPDLVDFLGSYRRSLCLFQDVGCEPHKVIVVSHSQGNLYGNRGLEILQGELQPSSNLFNIIAVATPASYVAGQANPCGFDCQYITLFEDHVATLVFPQINPSVLAWNTTNAISCLGLSCHDFIASYLDGTISRKKIRDYIASDMAPSDEAIRLNWNIDENGNVTYLQQPDSGPGATGTSYFFEMMLNARSETTATWAQTTCQGGFGGGGPIAGLGALVSEFGVINVFGASSPEARGGIGTEGCTAAGHYYVEVAATIDGINRVVYYYEAEYDGIGTVTAVNNP